MRLGWLIAIASGAAAIGCSAGGHDPESSIPLTLTPRVAADTTSETAQFIYPAEGEQNTSTNQPFQWTNVEGAQGYYLYIGSTQGADDLINSGGLPSSQTSYGVPPLPVGQTLWARIWTETNGTWVLYSDVSFTAAQSPAQFLYPIASAQNVNTSQPFQWTSAPEAQGYYLWVGTTQGASDLVNSGGLPSSQTSYAVPALPVGQTLWARVWTEFNSSWTQYTDVSFTADVGAAQFLYPTTDAQNISTSQPFRWTVSPGAQAYYLYVGTTQGTDDLVNSGGLLSSQTSYVVPPLLVGQTLWARIWTETNGTWVLYSDVSFTAAQSPAQFLYPTAGAQNVNTSQPFQWTSAPEAQGYYLWVGTTQGASDLVNSGGLPSSQTSYAVPALPVGQTLWARVWTEFDNTWTRYTDVSFTVEGGQFVFPAQGAQNVNLGQAFQWTLSPGAQGYYLWVGTTEGAKDLVNSGALPSTQSSYSVGSLPVGQTLWARIWTESNSAWVRYTDVSFTVAFSITAPLNGTPGVDPGQAFQWEVGATLTTPPSYTFYIGTSPGASDVIAPASLTRASYIAPSGSLPAGVPLYARVELTLGDGTLRKADAVFTIAGTPIQSAALAYPAAGETDVDVSTPFQWSSMGLAQAYDLRVLSTGTILRDTGPLHVTQYFYEDLQPGTYTARLSTEIAGQWYVAPDVPFTVVASGSSPATEVASALWATDVVRHMADSANYPFAGTLLRQDMYPARFQATCQDYRTTLLDLLGEMNVTALYPAQEQPAWFDIAFTSGGDVHTLVEFYNAAQQSWMILDPTFDFTARRASDGLYASKEDIQASTLSQTWASVDYVPLGTFGDSIARAYYLDYPLLYVNIGSLPAGEGNDPMPYLEFATPNPSSPRPYYAVQCEAASAVDIVVNGLPQTVQCPLIDSLSAIIVAATITPNPDNPEPFEVFAPLRYVF